LARRSLELLGWWLLDLRLQRLWRLGLGLRRLDLRLWPLGLLDLRLQWLWRLALGLRPLGLLNLRLGRLALGLWPLGLLDLRLLARRLLYWRLPRSIRHADRRTDTRTWRVGLAIVRTVCICDGSRPYKDGTQ